MTETLYWLGHSHRGTRTGMAAQRTTRTQRKVAEQGTGQPADCTKDSARQVAPAPHCHSATTTGN